MNKNTVKPGLTAQRPWCELLDAEETTVSGVLTAIQLRLSRQGRPYCTARLRTDTDSVPMVAYPVAFARHAGLIRTSQPVHVTGRVDKRSTPGVLIVLAMTVAMTP